MNKRYWHFIWTTYIRPVKISYLVVLTALSLVICVAALRSNNQMMGRLRQDVYTADKNNTNVVLALQNLQKYVTTHMNTDLTAGSTVYPPIQLKYTYQRLTDAAQTAATTANSQLYTLAQEYCQAQDSTDFSGRNRVPCIEQYVADHGGQKAQTIPDSMYKFAFATPRWSPDFAGWMVILTILFAVLLLARLILGWIFKLLTR
ncbi:MAG: hypothetical protein ACQR33_06365 [Candidatus Saccharibacteria bacterium]